MLKSQLKESSAKATKLAVTINILYDIRHRRIGVANMIQLPPSCGY